MIWFTWRQFRTQFWVAAVAVVVLAAALALAGLELADLNVATGLADCRTNCDDLVSNFLREAQLSFGGRIYETVVAVMYVTPALIGVFWGAPLVARELETGTYRLAWGQSVTRTRWLVTKLAGVGMAAVAVTAALSIAAGWAGTTLDTVSEGRIDPMLFGARGIVPVGYAAFAFALGVLAGMVIRRTVPAMAVTLAVYVAAVAAMPLALRQHLVPVREATPVLDNDRIIGLNIGPENRVTVYGDDPAVSGWVLSNETIDAGGQPFSLPVEETQCGTNVSPEACFDWIGTLGLRQRVSYHPLDQYWALQLAETGLFVGLALALAALSVWWLRRRIT